MKINKIISQNRRDFVADFICEFCGYIDHKSGYDDEHFHSHVIPAMRCAKCGKFGHFDYRPLTTKFPEGKIV